MKNEFHFTITHLIAARAGIKGEPLRILVHSSQLTDDNDTVYPIRSDGTITYRNRISQTMQPLTSHTDRLEVYPLFHFLPGDLNAPSAARVDGQTSPFNTTPNSLTANRIIDAAFATNDYYQIGIACHAFVDTWAHQNFVGFKSDLNGFSDFFDSVIPNIGHADAKTKPDQPRLVWDDERMSAQSVNNKQRFLEAASHLFAKLRRLAIPDSDPAILEADQQALIRDLDTAIGNDPNEVDPSDTRISGYTELAARSDYGATTIPEYTSDMWFKAAIKTTWQQIGSPSHTQRTETLYSFRQGHETSDWFKFQQAVIAYAERTKAILCENPDIAAQYNA